MTYARMYEHGTTHPHRPRKGLHMDNRAHARTADPATSHEAAALVTNLRPRQEAVLRALRAAQTADYTRLWNVYRSGMANMPNLFPVQTEQSVRSRCAELRVLGLVKATGEHNVTATGRKANVWTAVEVTV